VRVALAAVEDQGLAVIADLGIERIQVVKAGHFTYPGDTRTVFIERSPVVGLPECHL
jgi:hypothetical protein